MAPVELLYFPFRFRHSANPLSNTLRSTPFLTRHIVTLTIRQLSPPLYKAKQAGVPERFDFLVSCFIVKEEHLRVRDSCFLVDRFKVPEF